MITVRNTFRKTWNLKVEIKMKWQLVSERLATILKDLKRFLEEVKILVRFAEYSCAVNVKDMLKQSSQYTYQ